MLNPRAKEKPKMNAVQDQVIREVKSNNAPDDGDQELGRGWEGPGRTKPYRLGWRLCRSEVDVCLSLSRSLRILLEELEDVGGGTELRVLGGSPYCCPWVAKL